MDLKTFFSIFNKGNIIFCVVLTFISCSSPTLKKQTSLFKTRCASCHITPEIQHLTKEIWATNILPEMGARMGIQDSSYNPVSGLSFKEQEAIIRSNVYPIFPTISKEDWQLLKDYIISNAPDSLIAIDNMSSTHELTQFLPKPISLDSVKGSFFTFLEYSSQKKKLYTGDISGNLFEYDFYENKSSQIGQFGSAIIAYTKGEKSSYVTAIGNLNPSEIPSGKIFISQDSLVNAIPLILHRPVHNLVADLNNDGNAELVVSEFGNLSGKLSLLTKKDSLEYHKTILLNQPGTIRVLSKDMDKDGREDLIALTSQGDESITILYQEDNLNFRPEKVLRFSPIYGSSWFELIDFDGDGFDDIITANGDNADKSYIQKSYHGIRIHINDGKNNFTEKYFYSLNGATRLIAKDFDHDNDIDLAVISTFPDYTNKPEYSFVYLENTNSKTFTFNPFTFKDSKLGRWFLMDAGDVDGDGDEDIILSSFTYVFTPVPDELSKLWNEKNVDIMVLENKLIN